MQEFIEKRREKLLGLTNDPVLREEIDNLIVDWERARAKSIRRKEALRTQSNAFNYKNNRIRNLESLVEELCDEE